METTSEGLGFRAYRPPEVDRIWGIWGTYYHNIPKPYSIYLRGTMSSISRVSRIMGLTAGDLRIYQCVGPLFGKSLYVGPTFGLGSLANFDIQRRVHQGACRR